MKANEITRIMSVRCIATEVEAMALARIGIFTIDDLIEYERMMSEIMERRAKARAKRNHEKGTISQQPDAK